MSPTEVSGPVVLCASYFKKQALKLPVEPIVGQAGRKKGEFEGPVGDGIPCLKVPWDIERSEYPEVGEEVALGRPDVRRLK